MNIRSLIFIVLLTLSLFFVNQWFTSKRQNEKGQSPEAKKTELVTQKEQRAKEIAKRTAPADKLPIVDIYQDAQEQTFLTFGIVADDENFLTLSWDDNLPKEIFIKSKNVPLVSAKLITTGAKKEELVLYSSSEHPKILSTNIPVVGLHDVQLVNFTGLSKIAITLGEYQDGTLFFPSQVPQTNAIALYQFENHYYPIGLYKAADQSLSIFENLPAFNVITTYKTETISPEVQKKEEFYVLENEYMQIVFSTLGGAIAEINLPFKSDAFPNSVVLPINFDRDMTKKYPANDLFPNHHFHAIDKNTNQTVLKLPSSGGYYPLLRRGIIPGSNYPAYTVPPKYYGLNVISDDPETALTLFNVVRFEKGLIQLEARLPNRRIIKTFTFAKEGKEAPYCFHATIKVEGDSRGLWMTSGIPEVELISGSPAPTIKYSTLQNQKLAVEKISLPKTSTTLSSFQPNWVSNSNGYFTIIMDPLSKIGNGIQANIVPGILDPSRIAIIDSEYDLYPANKYPGYEVHLPLAQNSQPMEFRFFAGPSDQAILKAVDAAFTNPLTGYHPHYIDTQSFHGWFSFISEPFAKFLFFIMNFFHSITHSWGFSIILITIVLRIMLYPLNAWSIKSTLKLQEVSPRLQKLQEKCKKDPKKGQLELMQFYKENKVNPFGGCLPLIIQMPFLFGMFDLLKSTFSLRGASFIPGWIDNLTAPDVLFSWNYPIPFIGTEFHFLPILLGVVMFFQQKLSTSSTNKENMTDQQRQQQKMGSIMTVVFTVLFYKFPSGLNIYWLSSMSLAIVQQMLTAKKIQAKKKNGKEIIVKPKK